MYVFGGACLLHVAKVLGVDQDDGMFVPSSRNRKQPSATRREATSCNNKTRGNDILIVEQLHRQGQPPEELEIMKW